MFRTSKTAALIALLMVISLILAACGAPGTGTTASPSPSPATSPEAGPAASPEASPAASPETSPAASPAAAGGQLEIFSWWTGPGEEEGKLAMYDLYREQNPGVEIVDATVAGGAGANAKAVLATRMQGGNPPDSFQWHAGAELIDYVNAGVLEPVTFLFQDEGWNDVMPQLLIDQITVNGEIYSVPVNIHRSNVLWYNKQVFADNNLEPPTTMEDFFTVAEALQAAGVTPLAIGAADQFATPHLFESVLLAAYGPEDYTRLFSDPAAWADPRTAEAIENFGRMISYSNEDRGSLTWQDAAQRVWDGGAAMHIMGDWTLAYYKTLGGTPDEEFGWKAAPGTDGVFMWLSDSFTLPRNAPNRDNAVAWLQVAGSREGQDAFNPLKGSIPARTDADRGLYDAYLTSAMDDWASNQLAGSVVHGAAANPAFMTEFGNAINVFAADQDVQSFAQALADSAAEFLR
jgi:glucose/mannose transport system substrate-binding protein